MLAQLSDDVLQVAWPKGLSETAFMSLAASRVWSKAFGAQLNIKQTQRRISMAKSTWPAAATCSNHNAATADLLDLVICCGHPVRILFLMMMTKNHPMFHLNKAFHPRFLDKHTDEPKNRSSLSHWFHFFFRNDG